MDNACFLGDIFITLTGCKDVITKKHFSKMKDGAILSNAGHFDVEVSVADLKEMSNESFISKPGITSYKINEKTVNLLGDGRLVNLACGDGHPAEIIDMSFALQLLCSKYILDNNKLENKVYEVPKEIDEYVASLMLKSLKIDIDILSDAQKNYLESWEV